MIRKLILSFFFFCLVLSNDSFSQCGTESVTVTNYCPGQYAEFDITNTDPKVKYHWTNTASSSDYGFTNHFISPSTIPAGSGAVSYKYVKEITDTTGPRTKTTNLSGIAGNSNAAVGVATPSNSYGAIFDAQATIVINSIVVPVGTNYAPGSNYAVQVKITSSGGAVQNSAITSFGYSSLKPVSGTNNFYLLPVPVNLTVAAGTGYTLEVTMTTSDGNSLFYWFNPGTLGYPYTLNSAPSLITVKEKTYSLYSSNKIAAIMDWSITTLCPAKTVASNQETNAALCCTPVASAASITTSTGTNVVVSPFSMTLTANGLPNTHYYEWFKNGVLVSGSGGVGKTTLNVNSLGNYTVRAVIIQADITKYSCYKETAISIQERVLYAQASKVNACIGENITLTAKGATGNVTWSPATNLNVTNAAKVIATPTAVGSVTYNVSADVPMGNSVINGEFENGNTGFSSSLSYIAPTINLSQNQYSVRKSVNPQGGEWKECPDHTTGSGNVFYTDGPTSIGASVWKQTISVQPNTNYTFSAWVTNTYPSSDPNDPSYTVNATNARFQLQANGQALLATPFAVNGKTCLWENVKSVWNSGNNTSITIAVLDMNSDGYGNDFALDDITFGAPGTQTDKVTLNVTDCFFVNATALTTCKGDSVQIEAKTNGLFAGWQLQGGGTTGIKTPNNPITWVKPGSVNQAYVASATFQLGNLITNGDFEEGDNVGFTSDYTCCLGTGSSHYSIDTDPLVAAVGAGWAVSKKDHTSGDGLMYMSDGGSDPTKAVYKTTVSVVAGKQYAFSAWLANIHNEFIKTKPDTANNAKTTNLSFVVNGQNLGNIKLPLDTAWHQFYSTWTANITGTITVAIQDRETSYVGNDFVLDDIVFAPIYTVTKKDTINAGPCSVCNQPSSVNLVNTKTSQCEGTGLTLTGNFNNGGKTISNGGMYYAWYKQGASLTSASYSLISPNPTGTGSVNVPDKSFASLLKSSDEGKWVIRVQDGNNPNNIGCYKEDTVTILVKALPTVTAPVSDKVCSGNLFTGVASYTTNPSTGVALSWNRTLPTGITGNATGLPKTGQVSETLTSTNATNTNVVYKLTPSYSTAPACPGTAVDYTVVVNPTPSTPTATKADLVYCVGATAPANIETEMGLSISPAITGVTYVWYADNSTTTSLSAIPTVVTSAAKAKVTYYVAAKVGTCESARLAVSVTINGKPAIPTFNPTAPSYCVGSNMSVVANSTTAGVSYAWTAVAGSTATGLATSTISKNPVALTEKGTYTVVVTETATTCTSTANVTVDVIALPPTPTDPGIPAICSGKTTTLNKATPAASAAYFWYTSPIGGAPITNNTSTPILTSTTTLYLIDSSASSGCKSARTPVTVTVNNAPSTPTFTMNPNKTSFCVGEAHTLTALSTVSPTSTISYQWSNANTGTTATINGTTTQGSFTYEAIATANGCSSAKGTQVITVNPLPIVGAISILTNICEADTRKLTIASSKPTSTYTWTVSGTGVSPVTGTGATLDMTAGTGNISISVSEKDANGCVSASAGTGNIAVDRKPTIATTSSFAACAKDAIATTGNQATIGTGNWLLDAANTTTGYSIDNLTLFNSNVTKAALPNNGDKLTATWEISNGVCAKSTSTPMVITFNAIANAGVKLSVDKNQLCEGGTVIFTATGSNTGADPEYKLFTAAGVQVGTTQSPKGANTNTAQFTVANVASDLTGYYVELTSTSTCATIKTAKSTENVDVIVDKNPDAAVITTVNNTKICGDKINLVSQAIVAPTTGVWSFVAAGSTATANIDANTGSVTNLTIGSANFEYVTSSKLGICSTKKVPVTIIKVPSVTNPDAVVALNAGTSSICSNAASPTLANMSSVLLSDESGAWSVPAGALNAVSPPGLTSNLQIGANRFIYTITSSTGAAPCNVDTALVTINVEQEPDAANPGTTKKTCASTYTLGATAVTNGTGIWTPASAFAGDRTLPNAVATLVANQDNEFTWTVSNGAGSKCADKSNKVVITQAGNITPASPVATQSKSICSTDAAPLLNTTGVTVLKSEESYVWKAKGTATIDPITGQTAGLVVGDNTFQYIISTTVSGCNPDTGTVTIKGIAPPVASITLPIVRSNTDLPGTHTFNTSPLPIEATQPAVGYKGEWAVAKITPTSLPTLGSPSTTLVNSVSGMNFDESAKLTWTVSDESGTCTTPAIVTVTIERKNITEAKAKNDTVCFGSGSSLNYSQTPDAANLPNTSAGEKGEWLSVGSSPTPTPNNTSLNVSFTSPGDYEYTYRIFNPTILDGGGNPIESKNNFIIRVDEMPTTSNAGTSENVCTLPYPLAGNAMNASEGETGLWTGTGVTFTDATSNTSKTDGMTDGNTYILTWSIFSKYKKCAASTSTVTLKKLKNITTAKISTTTTDYCEGTSFSLASNAADGANNEIGEWISTDLSIPSADKNNTTLPLSNLTKGTYIVTWKISSSSCPGGSSDAITLNVDKKPVVGTIISTRLCEESDVAFTATGFTSTITPTYVWSAVANPSTTSNVTSVSSALDKATYTVKSNANTGGTDQMTVKVEATNGCGTTAVDTVYTFDLRPRNFAISFTSPTLKICASDVGPVVYNVTVSPALPAQTDFNWYWNGVKKATSGTSYSLNSADYVSKTGNINLEVRAYNQCGEAKAIDNASQLISIEINQSKKLGVTIKPAITDSVCVADLTLNKNQYIASAVTNGNALSGSETYTFSVSDFLGNEYKTSTNATGVYDATMLNDGDIVGVVLNDPTGCFDAPRTSAKATSMVNGFSYPNSTIISQNDTVCESKNTIKLEVKRTKNRKGEYNDEGIKWYKDGVAYDSSNYPIILKTPSQTGTYTVVMKGSVCPDSTTKTGIKAKIYELPAFEFTENPLVIVYQEGIKVPMPIILTSPISDPITKATWSNETWLEFLNKDTAHAIIVPKREQTEIDYSLIVRTGPARLNCLSERSILVINSLPLNIPNAFSPNGDGVNDTWVINGLIKYSSVTVSVFNRWGNKVFYSTGAYTPWDGTVNGIPISSGTYYAIVELKGSPDSTDDNVTKALTVVR